MIIAVIGRGDRCTPEAYQLAEEVGREIGRRGHIVVTGGLNGVMEAASKDGALDAKTKELMALAIGIALRCDGCIAYHTRAAQRHGATREEVAETIGVAVELGGGPAAVYGAEALAAFDQFAE